MLKPGVIASDELALRPRWNRSLPPRHFYSIPIRETGEVPPSFFQEIRPKNRVVAEAEQHQRRQQDLQLEVQQTAAAREIGSKIVGWSEDPDLWLQKLERRIRADLQ